MIGVPFPQANLRLVGSDEDKAAGNVYDLHVYKYYDHNLSMPAVISCWEPTYEELQQLIQTRKVWFRAWGGTHPPIQISVEPFKELPPE